MQIQLSGHHLDITPTLRDYVHGKLARLERHAGHVGHVHVVLSVEKLRRRAEATVQLNPGTVFADAEDEDLYAAIDALVDKLDRQVKKLKERSANHRGEGG